MTTLADLAAKRKPPVPSYAVRVWDPIQITWVVETLERFHTEQGAMDAAQAHVDAKGGRAQAIEALKDAKGKLRGLRVLCEVGVKQG